MPTPAPGTSIERNGRQAIVHVRGDVVVGTARKLHATLRALQRRRDVREVVLDFTDAGRLDSAGVAVVQLAKKGLGRRRTLQLTGLDERKQAAFELAPAPTKARKEPIAVTYLERVGEKVLETGASLRALASLVGSTLHQAMKVLTRRAKLPAGSVGGFVVTMGADAVFIVGLLSFLLGMTIAFQGVVQLNKFGAGVFVGDMVGMSMIREFGPMMTAIVLTGRTGAAIAAELGTMKVGAEIDALTAMGVSPVRFLVVPRLTALTFVGPALTLMAMFIGIAGGMLVAALQLGMRAGVFWDRVVGRVGLHDFTQGIGKSFVFAWIIGFAGAHLGMRATGDASSVGTATTRAVVVSIFCIIVVDAIFATITTLGGW
ncbi:MAG: ABC transporter permease [Deltaproteobacteria bacterium]|nr:ABC transporter permease [Deltaproteobacteria bacterium]